MRTLRPLLLRAAIAVAALLTASGCASSGRLAEYDFRDRTLRVVEFPVPRPEILTNALLDLSLANPLEALVRIGADVAKEVEAARARPRLESAADSARVGPRMIERVHQGAAQELRAMAVPDGEAHFELELRIRRYGIDADSWVGPARFFLESEVILRDGSTGQRIWGAKVTEDTPITPAIVGPGETGALGDVLTAAGLSNLSEAQMVRMLEGLADFAAGRMLDRLHRGMEEARN